MQNESKDATSGNPTGSFILLIVLVPVILVCASFCTTFGLVDGSFPDGEFHLMVEDDQGNPIQGAILDIYPANSRIPSYYKPFDNYTEEGLTSDQYGEIVIYHHAVYFEYGGPQWFLFWSIPIGATPPDYDMEIIADGYNTGKLSADDVFVLAYEDDGSAPISTVDIDGQRVKLRVYEMDIVLRK